MWMWGDLVRLEVGVVGFEGSPAWWLPWRGELVACRSRVSKDRKRRTERMTYFLARAFRRKDRLCLEVARSCSTDDRTDRTCFWRDDNVDMRV